MERLRKFTDCEIYVDDYEDSFDIYWDKDVVSLSKPDAEALIIKLKEWLNGL